VIRQSEIQLNTGYNTYQIDGLPPTPICNPGRDALMAVAHPATSNALYFVADGTGGHVFAATLAEHQANVARCASPRSTPPPHSIRRRPRRRIRKRLPVQARTG
jgi:UPF0755 protein